MMLFGLDWVATVPPTAILCTRIYGPERGPIVFGWVFASHMIGAAVAAAVTGAIRQANGDYSTAWFLAGALALAAGLAVSGTGAPVAYGADPTPTPTPLSSDGNPGGHGGGG